MRQKLAAGAPSTITTGRADDGRVGDGNDPAALFALPVEPRRHARDHFLHRFAAMHAACRVGGPGGDRLGAFLQHLVEGLALPAAEIDVGEQHLAFGREPQGRRRFAGSPLGGGVKPVGAGEARTECGDGIGADGFDRLIEREGGAAGSGGFSVREQQQPGRH